jgi:uncharacterized membrane-anchored protein YhcB (DUF1043 family)
VGIEDYSTKSAEVLKETLLRDYSNYYEGYAKNLENALKENRDNTTLRYSQITGSQEFINLTTEAQYNRSKIESSNDHVVQ